MPSGYAGRHGCWTMPPPLCALTPRQRGCAHAFITHWRLPAEIRRGSAPHLGENEFAMRQIFKPLLVGSACALALGLAVIALPEIAMAQVSVSITLAPPALPVYEQPMLVEEGGIWAPGYWSYNQDGYFWVPGTWVQPPEVGLLWTPAYWGWGNGGYAWNAG